MTEERKLAILMGARFGASWICRGLVLLVTPWEG